MNRSILASNSPKPIEVLHMTKRFGALTALDDVSIHFDTGTFHALLGENGAGKSTLVKCIMGFYSADAGVLRVDGKEHLMSNPRQAQILGLGMVYQHFTLVPSMTVAENLVLSEGNLPAIINWRQRKVELEKFMDSMPFRLSLDTPVANLAAGEKQKLEILKQLHLGTRFLILDEPTSVLTPEEADEILGLMSTMTAEGRLSVLMITHKLREVEAFAREVSVLRHGKLVGTDNVENLSHEDMVQMMIGREEIPAAAVRSTSPKSSLALEVENLCVGNDKGLRAVDNVSLKVNEGEIVGIAGVSGNGQSEFVEALGGQRQKESGVIRVKGYPYHHTRQEIHQLGVRILPEEPLHNSCVPAMTVAENLAIRDFDRKPISKNGQFINRNEIRRHAVELIERFGIKTQGPDAPIETLSGGNIQRTNLARELSGNVDVLIVQNPCFGLDLNAVAEIRNRIINVRNAGAAILLISEDLDEILELADRIIVMFEGKLVYETPRESADVHEIGRHMASNV